MNHTLKTSTSGMLRSMLVLCAAGPMGCGTLITVDQSNTPLWTGEWTSIQSDNDMWQSFTPSVPRLIGVDIDLINANPGNGDALITVEIRRGVEVLRSASQVVADGFDGLLFFNLFPDVRVDPGESLLINVFDQGELTFGWRFAGDTYPGGERFVFGDPQPASDCFFQTWGPLPRDFQSALEGAVNLHGHFNVLQELRDEVLANSAAGQQLIDLFYRHAGELSLIMLEDPALRMDTFAMIERFTPDIERRLAGEKVSVSTADLRDLESVLRAFESQAQPTLRSDLEDLRAGLRKGSLTDLIGVGLESRKIRRR